MARRKRGIRALLGDRTANQRLVSASLWATLLVVVGFLAYDYVWPPASASSIGHDVFTILVVEPERSSLEILPINIAVWRAVNGHHFMTIDAPIGGLPANLPGVEVQISGTGPTIGKWNCGSSNDLFDSDATLTRLSDSRPFQFSMTANDPGIACSLLEDTRIATTQGLVHVPLVEVSVDSSGDASLSYVVENWVYVPPEWNDTARSRVYTHGEGHELTASGDTTTTNSSRWIEDPRTLTDQPQVLTFVNREKNGRAEVQAWFAAALLGFIVATRLPTGLMSGKRLRFRAWAVRARVRNRREHHPRLLRASQAPSLKNRK